MTDKKDPFEKAGAAYRKPNLRSDLRMVYENPISGKGQARVIDAQSSRQYTFDEVEQYLCRAADGTSDLQAIYERAKADRGDAVNATMILEFYRRLHILGLLAPAPAEVAVTDTPAPATVTRGAALPTPMAGPRARLNTMRGAAAPVMSETPSASGRLAASRRGRAATGLATQTEMDAPGSEVMGQAPKETAADVSAALVDQTHEVIDPSDAFLSDPIFAAPAGSAARVSEPTPALVRPVPVAPVSVAPVPVAPVPVAPPAPPPVEAPINIVSTSPKRETVQRPAEADAGDLAPITFDDGATDPDSFDDSSLDVPDFDFFEDDMPAGGGAMRGGMGGMGGGAMGGGGFRGGMGGGGMGGFRGGMGGGGGMGGAMGAPGGMGGQGAAAGGANRERIMAAMANRGGMGGGAMGGAGMGGAMGGFGGRQQQPKPFTRKPWQLPLFNPTPLLNLFYYLFYPLKYGVWLTVPLVFFAGMIAIAHFDVLAVDFLATVSDLGTLGELAVGLLIVNLFARLGQGVAMLAHGGKVRYLGATLALGMFPHICIDKHDVAILDRQGQLWVHGTPLLARLMLFCGGIILWAIYRDTGTLTAELALMTSKCALAMFVATAWPLMPSDGMRWMATLFNEPKLQPKAIMAFKHVFFGGRLPPFINRSEVPMLVLFACGAILTGFGFLAFLAVTGAISLAAWGGTGAAIWSIYILSFSAWVAAVIHAAAKGKGKAKGAPGMDRGMLRMMAFDGDEVPALDPDTDLGILNGDAAVEGEENPTRNAGLIWMLIALGVVLLGMLPYSYDTGGQVQILPAERGQAVARTDGELVKLLVQEGDVVTAGQPVAELSSWDQENQIAVTEASLDGARAQLAKLMAGSTAEDIALAQAKVASAEANLAYAQAQADRARSLVTTGAMSASDKEKAENQLATVLADLEVAKANLKVVEAGATPEDIAIDQANIEKLERQLAYARDEMARTFVVAPVAGHIVTKDLNLKMGSNLKSGDTLLDIERTDVVTARIDIPEGDVPLLKEGSPVRLKLQGYKDETIVGSVLSIASAAEEQSYGMVVRVTAQFPNPNGRMVSGMTGYAKVEGGDMRTWEAYLRAFMRFFQIQVWSWIP